MKTEKMTNDSHNELHASMDKKETAELLEIWRANDRDTWSDDEFKIICEILQNRTGGVPPQVTTIYDKKVASVLKDKNLWLGLAYLLAAIVLAYYFSSLPPSYFYSHRDPHGASNTELSILAVVALGFSGLWKLLAWGDVVRQALHRRADYRKKRKLPKKLD